MSSKVKNNLAQLDKIERYIAKFQTLSNIHAQTLAEHNGQLDYTWKSGYETAARDLESLNQVAAENSSTIQQLRLTLSKRESELDNLTLKLSEQAKRHQNRIDELKQEIAETPLPIYASLESTINTSPIVENWRSSWKWISSWCFGIVLFFTVTPIPSELLAVLPENIRSYVIAWTAFCGFIGRYINQSK